ncbi:MAG: serine hydrolase [Eubacteriales bacterium]|nr:serine hydrolase [Eubacteriales bacterium]
MKKELTEKLNIFLDDVIDLNDLPGLAAGVSFGLDEPDCFMGARGYRNYTKRKVSHGTDINLLQPGDIFHCASVSKLFTSSAIMKLVEAGVLGLYDRLSFILPALKFEGPGTDSRIGDWRFDEIRLWNMLTHTSGLGDCRDYEWADSETDDKSLARYVYGSPDCIAQPMLWCPQTNPEFYGFPETDEYGNPLLDENGKPKNLFRYSNVAYEILGQIVAEYSDRMPDATGSLSYEDFVARYLLEPAGMINSTMKTYDRPGWDSNTYLIQNPGDPKQISTSIADNQAGMALPHEKISDRSIKLVETYPYNRKHGPSSTLTSNLEDLLRWGRAHMKSATGRDDLLLHKETYDSIWREYATVPNNGEKMGLGWFMRRQMLTVDNKPHCAGANKTLANATRSNITRGYTLLGHEGNDDGFRASFWMCPELELVTVVLSNLSEAPVKKINKQLFEICIT